MKKRLFALLLMLTSLLTFTACSDNGTASNTSTVKSDNPDTSEPENPGNSIPNDLSDTDTPDPDTNTGSKILVAFFSRADELTAALRRAITTGR